MNPIRIIVAICLVCLTANAQRFVKTVPNIAAMLAQNPNDIHTNVYVAGYYTPGDGGGGVYYYDKSSSTTTNKGSVLKATGYTGRYVAIFDGVYNVRRFGAKGDGVTDDISSITNAIMALPANLAGRKAGTIMLPAGTYKISEPIRLPTGIQLIGESTETSVIRNYTLTNDSICVIALTNPMPTLQTAVIRDLAIEHYGTCTAGAGINIDPMPNNNSCFLTIENVSIWGAYNGLRLNGTVFAKVEKLIVLDSVNNGILSEYTDNGSSFKNCYIARSAADGIWIKSGHYTSAINTDVEESGGHAWHLGSETFSLGFPALGAFSLMSCGVEVVTNGSGIYIENGSAVTLTSCYVQGGTNNITLVGGDNITLINPWCLAPNTTNGYRVYCTVNTNNAIPSKVNIIGERFGNSTNQVYGHISFRLPTYDGPPAFTTAELDGTNTLKLATIHNTPGAANLLQFTDNGEYAGYVGIIREGAATAWSVVLAGGSGDSSSGPIEAMRITSAGYVGIGTNTPTAPLTVTGSTYMNGLLKLTDWPIQITNSWLDVGGFSYPTFDSPYQGIKLRRLNNSVGGGPEISFYDYYDQYAAAIGGWRNTNGATDYGLYFSTGSGTSSGGPSKRMFLDETGLLHLYGSAYFGALTVTNGISNSAFSTSGTNISIFGGATMDNLYVTNGITAKAFVSTGTNTALQGTLTGNYGVFTNQITINTNLLLGQIDTAVTWDGITFNGYLDVTNAAMWGDKAGTFLNINRPTNGVLQVRGSMGTEMEMGTGGVMTLYQGLVVSDTPGLYPTALNGGLKIPYAANISYGVATPSLAPNATNITVDYLYNSLVLTTSTNMCIYQCSGGGAATNILYTQLVINASGGNVIVTDGTSGATRLKVMPGTAFPITITNGTMGVFAFSSILSSNVVAYAPTN